MKRKRTATTAGAPLHNSVDSADSMQLCKRFLKDRILTKSEFRGFEDKMESLLQLLRRAVWNRESNSALLVGHRGCGKTTLVRTVLAHLAKEKSFREKAIVVKLNGLIHTDDRLSLIAISKQLNLENVVDERVTGSFAENMALLLEHLKAKEQDRAIIFLLEEVALFCSHHNQTLLYNLFDIAHSNQASVCVLGITCRLDVLDLMEKRVKSRFSHRHIYLMPSSDKAAFDERMKLCKELLQLQPGQLGKEFVTRWNKQVEQLLQQGTESHKTLQSLFQMSTREETLRNFLLLLVCCLQEEHPQLLPQDFVRVFDEMQPDDNKLIASGLSVIEICLLIAINHLGSIYQGDPFNFEMVFDRYMKFARHHSKMQNVEKETLLKAFEHLQALELVVPVRGIAGSSRVQQREFQMHSFQLSRMQVRELVHQTSLPTEVLQWADLDVL